MSIAKRTTLQSFEAEPRTSCDSVLIAEDDIMSRKILQSWLENWGYRVTAAENGAIAWNILQRERPPELLILDWVMPEIDGMELCRRIRDRQHNPYQYILLVTARDEKQNVVRGLDAGADDYLTKPLDKNELRARLRVGERILTLQHDLIQAREDLRFQATHDALTGIFNRGTILEFLNRELGRAARSQSATGILMLDLDHFKQVNDTYGHLTGDVVLKEVAGRISQAVRSYDLVARYGGEEFLIVVPGCNADQIQDCAERVRSAIASAPVIVRSSEIPVTVSIGATVATRGAITATDILAAADGALYQAKNSGRNRAVLSGAGRKINHHITAVCAPESSGKLAGQMPPKDGMVNEI
jgi:diguanylate cyclase (GGDEF)-like protein